MERIERLINLTAYLLDSKRPVSLEELRSTVYKNQCTSEHALHRMFERDKEELREMGMEIETVCDPHDDEVRYTIPREKYYLPHIDLEPEERFALELTSRLFLGSRTPFGVHSRSALLKLAFEQGITDEEFTNLYWIDSPASSELLEQIFDGMRRRKVIRFSYRALDSSEPTEREVEPYGVFNRRGYWYLVGRCRLRGEIRCFKLERITSRIEVNEIKPKTPDFEVPSGFNIEREARWEWPLPAGEEDVVARVVFKPRLAFSHAQGPSAPVSLRQKDDGCLEATYEVSDPEQFVEWVLEFGTDAILVSPPELRALAKERIEGALRSAGRK